LKQCAQKYNNCFSVIDEEDIAIKLSDENNLIAVAQFKLLKLASTTPNSQMDEREGNGW
jgi:hypothetical protein